AAHAEDALENIGERRTEIAAEARPAATHALLESGMAEPIIGGALVAVLEHVIGFVDFLEALLAFGVAGIAIGVVRHRLLAISRLQLGLACAARNAQNLVITALRRDRHALALAPA